MRKRIQQLASGKFEYARPLLQFSTDKVSIEVLEGKDYTGDFVITSANRVPMRGIIYTSDPRMECLTPQFEGEEVRIRYQYHSYGLVEGDIRKGEFFMICNQGEYNLSFVASISKLYADSSAGKIRNLEDFTGLAKENFSEACRLFYSQNFKNVIKQGEVRELLLYEGLNRGAVSGQKVEEFLIGTGRKKKMDVFLSQTDVELYNITESIKETLEIRREQWGWIEICVSSDADFLIPGKSLLTGEDFLGSVCNFEYYIREEALHAGKNFGRLCFEIPGKQLEFSVCVSRNEKKEQRIVTEHREEKEGRIRLMKLYMDYRLKKIVTGAWANQSAEILDHLSAMRPDEALYPLMKAQALIVNRQRQEAAWIMEDFKREWKDHSSPEWGYYRYLCTLMEREPSYVDRVTAEIEEIFHKHPGNSLLFWVLLFVKDEYYRNNSRRLKAIEQWMAEGNKSPYFYLEAYYLIWQDPYLLGRLDTFETEVLNWARKQGAITKDIALVVMNIVPEKREFNRFIYQILEECYRVNPKDEMLAVICGYLIKGQRFETKYHQWYELGIEHELRITSLYEAYLMSMDEQQVRSVPRMLQMYFRYNSNLSYQQRAVLFVNIIAGKAAQPDVYQKYRRVMEQFAMEQMEAGHINDNLAVVYSEMLGTGILNEELAHRLAKILFTHKLSCRTKQVARAVILQKQLKQPQIVPVVNGTAYFQAYTDDYCVVLEDSRGNYFTDSLPFGDEALMNPEAYIERCMELAPHELEYILYHFRGKQDWKDFTEQDDAYFSVLLQNENVHDRYKVRLIPEIIRYYQHREYDGTLEKYLSRLEPGLLTPEAGRCMTELLVEAHMYEKAYRAVQVSGYDYMGNAARVALLSYAITDCGFEEDDFLLGFAENTFVRGKYNDVMLIYLCKYYTGATKIMARLWQAAGEFQIDTFDLEERILTQMLYTTEYVPCVEQIYDSYCAGGGRELVRMAYLSYFANSYLRKDTVVPRHVFVQLQERCLNEQELNDACKLGLLKYLAGKRSLLENQYRIADELLAEYTAKNIYFEFYRKFEKKLVNKYLLYDKFFIEYHTKPGRRVSVHCRMGEEAYQKEELTEMYDGIYVKEFILFFGESMQYYITEEKGTGLKVTESNCISNNDVLGDQILGRYAQLNEILFQITMQDTDAIKQCMSRYYSMQKVTEEVFHVL